MKRALVCKICDEVSWAEITKLHNRDRKYHTCPICFEFIVSESNVLPPLTHKQQKTLDTFED